MRRTILCLLAAVMAVTVSLKAQVIVIDDGFENGIQDTVWTQEFVYGNHPWAVESIEDTPQWPASIWQGSKRAYLRNTSGETEGYVTRLVSKVMDLRPEIVYQPELTFWYANPKWTADRDTLRVLYRTSQKADWKQLAEFSDAMANWQKVKLELPEVNATYQIAFEGTDNLGRGIVLDSVKLRSAPICTVPHDIVITNKGAGKINIAWIASWDANEYELVVTKSIINPDTVNLVPDSTGVIAYHGLINGLQQNVDVDLVSGEYYYVYLRSLCEAETSMWNSEDPEQGGQFRFRVKATKNIPYHYAVDMPYEAGTIRRDLEWTWGNNTGNFNPFINVYTEQTERGKYSHDETTCIVFTGANNMTTAIPAEKYAYVATPALSDTANANFALNQCVVRFWSTVYIYQGRNYARSLLVGVMTDPEDITTFEVVDTVSVWGTSTFVENVVDLSSYNGAGNYVAFASAFETQNIFYLDDITIEYKNATVVPTDIYVNPRATSAEISWKGFASSYNVMITNEEVDPDKAEAAQIVDQINGLTTNSYKTEALEADHSWNRPYYVYVQAVNGAEKSAWSYRYPFVTIAEQRAVPYTFDFEEKSGAYTIGEATVKYPTGIGIFSNDPEYPHLYTGNAHGGSSCMTLTKDWGNDSWITLPMIDSLGGKQVTFYLRCSSKPAEANATVGVMTNPMDIKTFIPVGECRVASTGYTTAYVNFENYTGPQGVIAIVWGDVEAGMQTFNYIDDLTVDSIAKCLPPVNVQMDATSDSVTVSWDKSDANTWEFILSKGGLSNDQLNKLTFDSISHLGSVLFADTLTWDQASVNPTFGFDSLTFNTPYFVYVRTLCGEEKTWWVEATFKTPCPTNFPIPFYDDFESYESVNLTIGCWTVRNQGATTYPKVTTLSVTGSDSKKAVDLYSTSTGSSYMAMPGVNGDLSNLLLTFDVRTWGSSVTTAPKALLIVGSMADFEDPNTFVGLDTFYLCGSATYENIKMNLADYNLTYNNIVFTSGLPGFADRLPAGISFTTSDVALDNVSLKPNTCIEAWNVQATDIQVNSIDIKWDGKTTGDVWKVKVMQDTVVVIADTLVNGKAFHAEGLQAVTQYTFYIQPSCDTIWTMETYRTGCVKLDPNKPNKQDFESCPNGTSYNASYQAPCWTSGNGVANATTSYLPYIYKSATYASSGTNTYRVNESSSYAPAYVASPEIDIDNMKDLAVTFNVYSSTSYYFVFGVMSDPEDISTFVALDSVKGTGKTVQFTYDLSEYADQIPANAKYCAWRGRYAAADLFYLDDVSIIKITCPLPKPSYSGLTASQVRISSGLRTDNEWLLLAVDTAAFSADQLALLNVDSLVKNDSLWQAHVVFYDTIDVRSKLITGLKEQTDYYVAVATVCEDGISQWQIITFKTPCLAVTPEAMGTITFSKAEGYETGSGKKLPCWTTGNKTNSSSTTYIPYIGTTSSYMHNGLNYLYVYSYVSSSTSYDGAYAIMPELNVDDISKYQVNFWARTTTSTAATYHDNLIVGVVTDPSDLNTFVVVDTLKLSHTAYEPFTVSLEDYQGDYMGNKGRYIMFMTETGVSGASAYGYAYMSEISVTNIPTCRPVTEFKVDSVSEDAAVISWKQYSDSYRMMMADKEVADDEKATYEWLLDTVVTKTDSVLITGLEASTQYYVYAQALCDGGDSSAISMAYAFFTTLCPANGFAVPYKQDFERYATNAKVVDCWDFEDYATATKTYPEVMNPTSGAVSGKQLEMWSTSTSHRCVAIMPKVQGNLADYMLSFDARSYSVSAKSVLYIGTMDNVLDSAAGFAPFDTLYMDGGNEFYHKDLVLADYASKLIHSRIAFSSGLAEELEMASDMYLDNVKIGMPPSCYAPTLEPGNTSLNTAEVKIIPAKEWNNKWQIAVVPDSVYSKAGYDAAEYLASDTVRIVDADSANFVVSGLKPGTLYWFYGRTVCGGEDGNSDWTNFPVKARTKYYFKDSYYFGFEKSEGWEFCQGSTSTTYWINPAIEVGYDGGSATTSYTSYYPYCMGNTTSAVYAYGPREASDPKNAALRWYSTSTYWGGYAVFPGVAEAHDRSFEFKVRCGYGSYNSTKDTIGISTNYACDIEVGTIDKNKGFETYQLISTINLPVIPKVKGGLTEANDWFWTQISLDLDSATVANKQMVLRLPKSPDSNSRYIHFDDVTLDAPKGFGMVSIGKIRAESQKAVVNWDNVGGPWNLYILKANGDTLKRYENLTDVTSQEVTGLNPQTTYTAVLVAANAPANTKFKVSDTKEFRTPCLPMEPNANGEFVWDFNDPSDWERSDVLVGGNTVTDSAYWKPGCFTTGTTYASAQTTTSVYYNWLIQRKGYAYTGAPTTKGTTATSTARYEYGRDDSPALRVYTSSTYMTPYIVLPELNCSFDTMMVEFWGRCLANYAADYGTAASQNKMVSASYCGGSYSQKMVVGTLTDPHDFSTLEVLDTLTYTAYTSTTAGYVTDDPSGYRYWQQMKLPLAGAKGKYIVLFQPAYGLFFVDDLAVKPVGDNLFAPSGAKTSNVTTTSATFSWIVKHPTIQSVIVVTDQDGENEILRDTVPGTQTTYTVDTLKPGTVYKWYMYQTNGTINTTSTATLPVYTECVAVGPDYETSFELAEGWRVLPAQTSETYKQTMCWTYENAGTSAVSTYTYNYAKTATLQYSHNGDYAVRLYASGTTYQTYAAMPAIEDIAAYDTLQVNFWMRPGYHNPSTGKISTQYTLGSTAATKEYYYSKSVIVGTMTDPMDATTFVPIDTVTYKGTLATTDVVNEGNEYLFQPKKVALTGAQGKYVAFMATLWAKGAENKSTYDYVWIDDVSFSVIQHCEAPEEMEASDISATNATLTWKAPEGADKYIVQVSTDYTFTEDTAFVFNDTVYQNSFVVDSLSAYTQYVWRVRTICGEDLGESDFSQNASFTTARQPFFIENFGATNLDADWTFATNPAAKVIDSADVELTGANSTSYGWRRVTTDAGLSGAHYAVVFYSSSSATTVDYDYYWMISPVISLSETDSAHLSFDMALTGCSASTTPGATKATEAQMADDYTFLIVISEDGGKTYKKENIIGIWNNTLAAGHQLRDIPFTGTHLRINLAKYAGKNIRIAFYREADTYKGSSPYTCAIHLDNIRVNYYDNVEADAQACQYQDVEQLGFFIDGDKAEAGAKVYKRIENADNFKATTEGYHDSIFILNVEYLEVPETILMDTICEGESYSGYDFTAKTRAGVYRRKLQSVESCDSLITLYLNVAPIIRTDAQEQTICPGEAYIWNGKQYNRAGIYRDTLISMYSCDSIETLVLSYYSDEDTLLVNTTIETNDLPYTYMDINHPYIAGQDPISYAAGTAAGTYIDTVYVQGTNCAAVLVHTLVINQSSGSSLEEILDEASKNGTQKIIYRDNLYIIREGVWTDATGRRVRMKK